MTRLTVLTLGASALLSLGLIGGAATMALADSHKGNDNAAEAQAFLAAPGSITAAIAAAEAHSGGKAMSAEFEDHGEDAGWYDVEVVMADGTTTDLLVNPADGTVKATSMDEKGDHEGDGDGDAADDSEGGSDSN